LRARKTLRHQTAAALLGVTLKKKIRLLAKRFPFWSVVATGRGLQHPRQGSLPATVLGSRTSAALEMDFSLDTIERG